MPTLMFRNAANTDFADLPASFRLFVQPQGVAGEMYESYRRLIGPTLCPLGYFKRAMTLIIDQNSRMYAAMDGDLVYLLGSSPIDMIEGLTAARVRKTVATPDGNEWVYDPRNGMIRGGGT